jgi:hypothetical protein
MRAGEDSAKFACRSQPRSRCGPAPMRGVLGPKGRANGQNVQARIQSAGRLMQLPPQRCDAGGCVTRETVTVKTRRGTSAGKAAEKAMRQPALGKSPFFQKLKQNSDSLRPAKVHNYWLLGLCAPARFSMLSLRLLTLLLFFCGCCWLHPKVIGGRVRVSRGSGSGLSAQVAESRSGHSRFGETERSRVRNPELLKGGARLSNYVETNKKNKKRISERFYCIWLLGECRPRASPPSFDCGASDGSCAR